VAAVAKVQREAETGELVDRTNLTVKMYLTDTWLPALEADLEKNLRPSTLASYRSNLLVHVVPRLGHLKLQALTDKHLNELYHHLITEGRRDGKGGLSARSVRYVHVLIHAALAHAVRENLIAIAKNPADRAKPPKEDRATALENDRGLELKPWSPHETKAFLERARIERLHALWVLAITTGMRRGELLGLRWSDVDFETGRLKVRRALISVGYQVSESQPKTAKSRREIGLDAGTVAVLKEWRKGQLEDRLKWGPAWVDSGYIFTKEDGSPLHPDRVSKIFNQLVAAAELRRIRFHDLRHGWATLALEAGIPAKVVQERLGHSSINVTLDVYSHVVKKLDIKAAETVAHMIGVTDVR
jgi:integrase